MDIGLTPSPDEAPEWFARLAPTRPKFVRVFSKPGAGLPNLDGKASKQARAAGALPWYSHKDPVPLDAVRAAWEALRPPGALPPTRSLAEALVRVATTDPNRPPPRRIRWTYHHEAAPMDEAARDRYHAYWSMLYDAAQDCPWIELVQIQSDYAMSRRNDTRWSDWIVPLVSLGFDCYPLAGVRYEPPAKAFGLLQYAAREFDCPSWGVPELGAEHRPGQDRGDWLWECVEYLGDQGAAFVGLWCSQEVRGGKKFDYRPTDPKSLDRFRILLERNR